MDTDWIRELLSRPHRFTLRGVLMLILKAAFSTAIFAGGYYVTDLVGDEQQAWDRTDWIIALVGGFVLSILTATYNKLKDISRKLTESTEQVAFETIAAAVHDSIRAWREAMPNGPKLVNPTAYFSRLLREVESVVFASLEDREGQVLNANLMIPNRPKNPTHLIVEYWGSRRDGRKHKKDVPIENMGAPAAFRTRRTFYTEDVRKYPDSFGDGKGYLSVLSIPIPGPIDGDDTPLGVINIDSNKIHAFGNRKYVERVVRPRLQTLVYLFTI